MYICMNKFSASGLDHKPLHVFRTQQEVAYVYKTNLMISQQFIKVFTTKVCPIYLSPIKPTINLSKSFHAGFISQSFPAKVLHYMVIKSLLFLEYKNSYTQNILPCL